MDNLLRPKALVAFHDLHPETESFADAVASGLSGAQKSLPCKFIYDERGSQLFDRICTLDEYYPTRTEIGLLRRHHDEIAALIGPDAHLIELGSGASVKIRLLLESLDSLAQYTAVDISRDFLLASAEILANDYPDLRVAAVYADYTRDFVAPDPEGVPVARRVAFFPGSTIGNFSHEEAATFLGRLATLLGPGGGLLIGVDLDKDVDVLRAAYNDSEGVTAAFNLNLLHRINGELGGDFDLEDGFRHDAVYVETPRRIEMRLVSNRQQSVTIEGRRYDFEPGEYIHTENTHKFTVPEFRVLCEGAGFTAERSWIDDDRLFSVHYFSVA